MFRKSLLFLALVFPITAWANDPDTVDPGLKKMVERVEAGEDPEQDMIPERRIKLGIGVASTSQYFFRGLLQENQGVIGNVWLQVDASLYEDAGPLTNVAVFVRGWSSLHSGPSGTEVGDSSSTDAWYENDVSFGLSLEIFDHVKGSGIYTIYSSPNDQFETVEEVVAKLELDDSFLWDDVNKSLPKSLKFNGFQLYGLIAWETDGQHDGGLNDGIYAEIGIRPSVTWAACDFADINIALPVRVGLSVFEYYETPTDTDSDFGFVEVGLEAEVPIKAVPEKFGAVSVFVAGNYLHLGQNTRKINQGDAHELIGSGGLRYSF